MKLTETATQSSSSVRGASEQNEPSVRKDGRGGGGSRNFGGGPGHSGQSVLFNASSSSILQARVLKRRKRRRLIQRIRLKQIRIPSSIKRVKRVNSDVFFFLSVPTPCWYWSRDKIQFDSFRWLPIVLDLLEDEPPTMCKHEIFRFNPRG